MQRKQFIVLIAFLLISSSFASEYIVSSWDGAAPVRSTQVPDADLASAETYGFSLWFRYNYRIPHRVDISQMVNGNTAIAGVTEGTSYMADFNAQDKALSVYFLPFGEQAGPVIRFATYNLNGSEEHIDISCDVDEVDGSWNWIYFGYSHTDSQAMAAYKGSRSDLKAVIRSNVAHNSPTSLLFQAGNPGSHHTINGYFYDISFNYGTGSFMGLVSDIEAYFAQADTHHPQDEACDCGGTVMTPEHDFQAASTGYQLSWSDKHLSPQEYCVFGWGKVSQLSQTGHHMIFRLTINDEALLGDAEHLGDRALFMGVEGTNVVGATYSYDIQGQSLQRNMINTIVNDEEADQWFFVYAGYSHRYNRVSYFVHFADRDEHFVLSAKHFYSNYYSILIGKDAWNNPFPGIMKKFHISFCDGAYRTQYYENLYNDHIVASVGFDNQITHPCHLKCDTCETSSTATCITCGVRRSNPPACPCDEGYYEDTSTFDCIQCDYTCHTCSSATTCITCCGNRVSNNGVCGCPPNTFDEQSCSCPPCPGPCETCDLAGNCLTCAANRENLPDCTCIAHHFETLVQGHPFCEVCDVRCNECSNVFYMCDDCAHNSNRSGAPQCPCPYGYLDQCGENVYAYGGNTVSNGFGSVEIGEEVRCTLGECLRCSPRCAECVETIDKCTSCSSSLRSPVDVCPCIDGYYEEADYSCQPCPYKCLTCRAADLCDVCAPNSHRNGDIGDVAIDNCHCADGWFDNGVAECVQCSNRCVTCVTSATTCTTEPNGCNTHRNTPPACPCNTGYWENGNLMCEECAVQCYSCTAESTCTECEENRIQLPTCHCPYGYFNVNLEACPPCDCSCHTCQGSADNNGNFQLDSNNAWLQTCLTCSGIRVLRNNLCVCPDGYFELTTISPGHENCTYAQGSNDGTCSTCHFSCSLCSGSDDNCHGCIANVHRTLTNNSCPCDDGYYSDGVNAMCIQCNCECGTCVDGNTCSSCKAEMSVENNQCTCDDSHFFRENCGCSECLYKCLTCETYNYNCLECAGDRVQTPPSCPCNDHYYELQGLCEVCSYRCANCIGNEDHCTSCPADSNRTLTNDACPCNGITNIYDDGSSVECQPCKCECASCTNATECSTCKTDAGFTKNTSNNQCECASTHFHEASSCTCVACSYKCLTCVDSADNCTSCPPNSHRPDTPDCDCDIPNSKFEDGNVICPRCHHRCQECHDTRDNCDVCDVSRVADSEPTCQCPVMQYEDQDEECHACNWRCADCDTYVDGNLCAPCGDIRSGAGCLCPVEGYWSDDDNEIVACIACDTVCSTCNGGPPGHCMTCIEGHGPAPLCPMLPPSTKSAQVEDIPVGSARTIVCATKCAHCVGSSTNCASPDGCDVNRNSPPTCPCNDGYYEDSEQMCQPCRYDCLTCTCFGDGCCNEPCAANRVSSPDCDCPVGYYDDFINAQCPPCAYNCCACETSASNCTTCCENRINLPTCECPYGWYEHPTTQLCTPCSLPCDDCTSDTICVTCPENSYRIDPPNCGCQGGYYDDGTSEVCPPCHYSCSTCDNSNTCITCCDNREFQLNATMPDVCTCPTHTYDTLSCTCPTCSYDCLECSSSECCTSCPSNRIQNSTNSCNCDCPTKHYDNGTATCQPCDYWCKTCSAPLPDRVYQCDECEALRSGISQNCPCIVMYYEHNQDCLPCSYKCSACTVNADNCDPGCSHETRENPPYCDCKPGYYDDGEDNAACQPCSYRYTTCSGPTHGTQCACNRTPTPTCDCPTRTLEQYTSCCPACDVKCATCVDSVSHCETCYGIRDPTPHCPCPAHHRAVAPEDDINETCELCPYYCSECDLTTPCTVCWPEATHHRLQNNPCDCKDGYYDNGVAVCVQCDDKCATCDPRTVENGGCNGCCTCSGVKINPPACHCPEKHYLGSDGVCYPCDYTCSSCTGSETGDCVCEENRINSPDCICPPAYFDIQDQPACEHCSEACTICTACNNCTQCVTGRVLVGASCNCPDGTTESCSISGTNVCDTECYQPTCLTCDVKCETCQNGVTTDCVVCAGNRINPNACTCPPGTYENNTAYCPTCGSKCATCSNASNLECCDTCAEGRVIDTTAANASTCNNCVCPSGTYYNTQATPSPICDTCHYACDNCTAYHTCDGCSDINTRTDNTLCPCIDNYYDCGVSVCCQCESQCHICEQAPDHCIVCASDRINPPECHIPPQEVRAARVEDIPVGSASVVMCNCECLTCEQSASNCLTCEANRVNPPTCSVVTGWFEETDGCTVTQCPYPCITCTSATGCTSCHDSTHRSGNVCNCEEGWYNVDEQVNCHQCPAPCKSCSQTSIALVDGDCEVCAVGRVVGSEPACPCPDGQVDIDGVCQPCSYKCATCSGTQDNCVTCADDNRNPPSACDCNDGHWDDGQSGTCNTCQAKCETCSNGTGCDTCASHRKAGTQSICPCDDDHYEINPHTTQECEPCSSECATCNILMVINGGCQTEAHGSSHFCCTCAANRTNAPVCHCSAGYFANPVECDTCNLNRCLTCVTTDVTCNACAAHRKNNPPACDCPDGSYELADFSCTPCPAKCATCNPTNTTDGGCSNGTDFCCTCAGIRDQTTAPTCSCPGGYYSDDNNTCQPCHQKCATCSSYSTCITCNTETRKSSPVPECPCQDGDWGTDSCSPCAYPCLTCEDNANDCKVCSDSTRVGIPDCACDTGYYNNGVAVCPACDPSCHTCAIDADKCTQCTTTYTQTATHSTTPVTHTCTCLDGSYVNADNQCVTCPVECITCGWSATTQAPYCFTCSDVRTPADVCPCPSTHLDQYVVAECDPCCDACLTCANSICECVHCAADRVQTPPTCPCPSGSTPINGDCTTCDYRCAECSGTVRNCAPCAENRVDAPTCSCPSGHYHVENQALCPPCGEPCAECTDEFTCLTCAEGRINPPECIIPPPTASSARVSDVPVGSAQVVNCSYNCESCSQDPANCHDCRANSFRENPQTGCLCQYGYFEDTSLPADEQWECQVCNYRCTDCNSNSTNDAPNCKENECADIRINAPLCKCPAGYYDDGSNAVCVQCNQNCATCGTSTCNGQTVTPGTCCTCSANRENAPACTCIAGYYEDSTGVCQPCVHPCATCTAADVCVTCVLENRCMDSCDCCTGYYEESNSCHSCNFKCEECTAPTSDSTCECTTCKVGSMRTGEPCCTTCPDGYYDDGLHVNCKPCTETYCAQCLTCDEHECLTVSGHRVAPDCSCEPGRVNIVDNTQSPATETCEPCNYRCLTCSVTRINCNECSGDRISPPACGCPNEYYDDGSNITCPACGCNCLHCEGSADHCTVCREGRTGLPDCLCSHGTTDIQAADGESCALCNNCAPECDGCHTGSTTDCIACKSPFVDWDPSATVADCRCPSHQYVGPNGTNCLECDWKCSECVGTSDGCAPCRGNRADGLNSEGVQTTCVCPHRHYEAGVEDCQPCSYKCEACHTAAVTCTECYADSHRVTPATCDCGHGYYETGPQVSICGQCDDNCNSCITTSVNCTSCHGDWILNGANVCIEPHPVVHSVTVEDIPVGSAQVVVCSCNCLTCMGTSANCGTCQANRENAPSCTCVSGYYEPATGCECQACDYQCCACHSTADNCTCCTSNRVSMPTCECPVGYYDEGVAACSPCQNGCCECTALNVCQGCCEGHYLHESLCPITCPEGYWASATDRVCYTCHETCGCCSAGGIGDCNCCHSPRYLQDGQCKLECEGAYYPQTNPRQCSTCHTKCSECTAEDSCSCSACTSGNYLEGTCCGTCPEHKFPNHETLTCDTCHTNCATCRCSGENCCDSCPAPRFLYIDPTNSDNSRCPTTCPNGYWGDATEGDRQCRPCVNNCSTCFGGAANNCITCIENHNLNVVTANVDQSCVSPCPAGKYNNNGTCTTCTHPCETCSGSGDHCESCVDEYFFMSTENTCYQPCPQRYFNNTVTGNCSDCDATCLECTAASAASCTKCEAPRYLDSTGHCVLNCNQGEYGNKPEPRTCNTCPDPCASCSQTCNADLTSCEITCVECDDPLYLNTTATGGWECIETCPSGYYASSTTPLHCITCESPCLTCSDASTCTDCLADHYYLHPDGTCSTPCPQKYFGDDATGRCEPCHTSCRTCDGPTENDCTTCTPPNYKSGTTCITECPAGEYEDSTCACSPNDDCGCCKSCHNNCATCTAADKCSCETCDSGFYSQQGTNLCCESTCPYGQYPDNATRSCTTCDSECCACTGAGNTGNCTACCGDYALHNSTCVDPCPEGYYALANVCTTCNTSCKCCDGGAANNCTCCEEGYFLDADTNTCSNVCPPGTWQNDETNTCDPCSTDGNCCECNGPNEDQCTACCGDYYKQHTRDSDDNITGTHCVLLPCASGKYPDAAENYCKPCHQDCCTCTGGNNNDCETCCGSLNLHGNVCISPCPDGYYADNNECKTCDESCCTCNGSGPNACTTCDCVNAFLKDNACHAPCADGYYGETYDNSCQPCHSSCCTCDGATGSFCLTCCSPRWYYPNNTTGRTCVEDCPWGYYGGFDDNNNRVCKVCEDNNCGDCSSSTCCGSCLNNTFHQDSCDCVDPCRIGKYGNTITWTCDTCNEECAECHGPLATDCDECPANKYKHTVVISTTQTETTCVTDCPYGYYNNDAANPKVCSQCHSTCCDCHDQGANACTECCTGTGLYQNTCVFPCPDGYYLNGTVCSPCHSSCGTCTGGSASDCSCCAGNAYEHNNECLATCPETFYNANSSTVCSPCENCCGTCDSSCLWCNGSTSQHCTKCLLPNYLQGTACLPDCENGKYKLDSSEHGPICDTCHPTCATCTVSNANNMCCSCPTGSYVNIGAQDANATCSHGTCVQTCPVGYFEDSTVTPHKCTPCNSPCACCSTDANTCCSCTEGFYLHGTNCVTPCPSGYWADTTDMTCQECDATCATCVAANTCAAGECSTCTDHTDCNHGQLCNATLGRCMFAGTICNTDGTVNTSACPRCITCIAGLYKHGSACYPTCPYVNQWANDNGPWTCDTCHTSCKCCDGADNDDCTCCYQGTYLHERQCKGTCPDGTYPDDVTGRCENCNGNCQVCTGPLATNCGAPCSSGNYFYDNQCHNPCPSGTYTDLSDATCKVCHHRCATCNDATYTSCPTCNDTWYHYLDSCLTCPECSQNVGYYCESSNNSCAPCANQCHTCTDSADNCTECKAPRTGLPNCNCPDGYFDNGNTCVGCAYNCATCDSRTNCLTCADIRIEAPTCDCPLGWYDNGETICDQCDYRCSACNSTSCTDCHNADQRSGSSCECQEGWVDDVSPSVNCVEADHPTGLNELIPTTPFDTEPATTVVEIDPTTLGQDYEIGFGFYYRYMFRNPVRVELAMARENWLGVAGLTENGDYGTFTNPGDRALTVFQWPWESNGMQVQFGTYDLDAVDNNVHKSIKIADQFHQQWHYVYFSYSHSQHKAVAAIKPNATSDFIVKEFNNCTHKDASAMTQNMQFFLGSSLPTQFQAINGYFYNARLNTATGAFKGDATAVSTYYSNIARPPSQLPGTLVQDIIPGESSISNLHCDQDLSDSTMNWTTATYSFAESYAVWGWAKQTEDCSPSAPQELFRLVIDTPEEVSDFTFNESALGTNVLTGKFNAGSLELSTYTFGIQNDIQDTIELINLGDIAVSDWFFYYISYSWQDKQATAYVNVAGVEYTNTAVADHMIPKYFGMYVGNNVAADVRDPTVCISGLDNDCNFAPDYNDIMNNRTQAVAEAGEIPCNGPNPQAEVEVPDNQLSSVTEYSFGLWFRFQFRIPERLDINIARNSFLAMAGVTENGDWTQTDNLGDRALSIYYVKHEEVSKPTYRFGTYNVDTNTANVYKQIDQEWSNFEGHWYYIYFGYSYTAQQASAYMRNPTTQAVKEIHLNNKVHNTPLNALTFSLGASTGFSVNGLYADLQFNWNQGNYCPDVDTFNTWFTTNVQAHPVIAAPSYVQPIVCLKQVQAAQHSIAKVEHADEFQQSTQYAVYSWLRWDTMTQLPRHFVFRLTINEPEYQEDASILGDRTLMLTLSDDNEFVFSTYNFQYNVGHDQIDHYKNIPLEDNLGEWCWVYFGYNRDSRTAVAYVRFADREVTQYFDNNQHFLPKYFGLQIANQPQRTNGWNGWLKATTLCMGANCYLDQGFETLNHAVPIDTADSSDPLSLGPNQPGIEEACCDSGMSEPCPDVTHDYEGSATVAIDWPPIDASDLIEQPYDQELPTAQVTVDESFMPYITQYSYGFWYQFRFRSPRRMDIDVKRSGTHGVAGVTENDSYCNNAHNGDRALSLFFKPWAAPYTKPTYEFCTYDIGRNSPNVCEQIEFEHTNVDAMWFYVYSGFSQADNLVYSAFIGETNYKAITIPSVSHHAPPAHLIFNLGTSTGFEAVNGYFWHVEFQYDNNAFVGTERALRDRVALFPRPVFFVIDNTPVEIQVPVASYTRWGPIDFQEWPTVYDGALEWATYGWARIEGALSPLNEFFRLTINNSPVGDAHYLGDRSLVCFINSENQVQKLYFAVYNYGYASEDDQLSTYHEIVVTGEITDWFYVYTAYSVRRRAAMIYVRLGGQDNEQFGQISSFQFVPKYFGLYLARDNQAQYAGFQGDIQQWYFIAGDGAWIHPQSIDCEYPGACYTGGSGDDCIGDDCTHDELCVILYEECNYEGMNTRICADTPFTDIDYEVRSIQVPAGRTIYLYNLPCFNGQNAMFTTSVECLTSIDFSMIQRYGITLMEEEVFLQMDSGLSARFRRTNLRKSTSLKTYQR